MNDYKRLVVDGLRMESGRIHTFVGVIGEPTAGLENIAGVESARRAGQRQARPGLRQAGPNHVFVGFTQGVALSKNSLSQDDTLVQSDGESLMGETKSILLLHDGGLGHTDDVFLESPDPPRFAAVYMAGRQDPVRDPANPMAGQNNLLAGSGGAGASASGSQKTGVQALADLMTTLTALLTEPVTIENATAHNTEITKCHEQMAKI